MRSGRCPQGSRQSRRARPRRRGLQANPAATLRAVPEILASGADNRIGQAASDSSSGATPGSGGASTTTCAFVPPKPKALMAARRPPTGQGIARPSAWKLPSPSGTWSPWPRCGRLGGNWPASIAKRVFSSPAMPAAGNAWPILAFTDPIAQRAPPKASANAASSIGSPMGVPVPCASIRPMLAGSMPARHRGR